jgi:hypothetical protein
MLINYYLKKLIFFNNIKKIKKFSFLIKKLINFIVNNYI